MPGFGEGAAQIKAQLHPANLILQDRAQVRGEKLKGLDGQAAGTDFDPGEGGLIENKRFQPPLEQFISQGSSGGAGPDDGNLANWPRAESWSTRSGGGAPISSGNGNKKQLILVPVAFFRILDERPISGKTGEEDMNWLGFSLLALGLWGVWGFLGKLAAQHLPAQQVYLLAVSGHLAVGGLPPDGGAGGGLPGNPGESAPPWGPAWPWPWAFSGSSEALGRGPATVVVPLTALYPAITVLLSRVFLQSP